MPALQREPTLAGALDLLSTADVDAAGDVMQQVLAAVRTHLGLDIAFVGEFTDGTRVFRHVESNLDVCPVRVGDVDPLESSYCLRVVDGRLPALMTDARQVPAAQELPVTHLLPVGGHVSVPIVFSDGRVYGTFCAFSQHEVPDLRERDLVVVRLVADLVAAFLERAEAAAPHRDAWAHRVRDAVVRRRLRTVLQPVVDLQTGAAVGVEALSRFDEGTPDEWFRGAARAGLGVSLELAALDQALHALDAVPRGGFLSVNLSPAALCSTELRRRADEVPWERVVVELTEQSDITSYEQIVERVTWLRDLGARLAVDDVGAGYAGLQRVLVLSPDVLKLDIGLTRNVHRDESSAAMVRALTWFADRTATTLIAEGIESTEQRDALRSAGVRLGQGFLLGRPTPYDA